jgi:hypothetical protein
MEKSMPTNRDSRSNTETHPTHDEISIRAYHLYLQGGDDLAAAEYWLIAEHGLKKELSENAKIPKDKTLTVVMGRVVSKSFFMV